MKRNGFTLAELLITLGIVGIITALIIPAINHLLPDKNKTLYLKAYDTLSKTVKDLASNSKLYPLCRTLDVTETNPRDVNCKDYPLFNLNKSTLDSKFNKDLYSGDKKLCSLLAFNMGVSEANINCKDDTYNFATDSFDNDFNSKISFITTNGMQWMIVPAVASSVTDENATFQTDAYVDINGVAEPNCIYSANCSSPDRFKFIITADGAVVAADSFGQNYLKQRKNLSKINDKDINLNIITNAEKRTFEYAPCTVKANTEGEKGDDGLNGGKEDNSGKKDDVYAHFRIGYFISGYVNKYVLKSKDYPANYRYDKINDYNDYSYSSKFNDYKEYIEKINTYKEYIKKGENFDPLNPPDYYVTMRVYIHTFISDSGCSTGDVTKDKYRHSTPVEIYDSNNKLLMSCNETICEKVIVEDSFNPESYNIVSPENLSKYVTIDAEYKRDLSTPGYY